jgi:cbb3-type cytochrome oxidase subunit 3
LELTNSENTILTPDVKRSFKEKMLNPLDPQKTSKKLLIFTGFGWLPANMLFYAASVFINKGLLALSYVYIGVVIYAIVRHRKGDYAQSIKISWVLLLFAVLGLLATIYAAGLLIYVFFLFPFLLGSV